MCRIIFKIGEKMYHNILLIGAFILLSTIILSLNTMIINTDITTIDNETHITGLGLAQALMEEITSCEFDEKTTGTQMVKLPYQLTAAAYFGAETGEPPYDDVNDYHNYSTTKNTPRIDGFQLYVQVKYANPVTPKLDSSIRTFLKRIEITVSNPKYMHNPDSIKVSSVVAYFK